MNSYPKPPDNLGPEGKAAWAAGEPLWERGQLTDQDLLAWTRYCRLHDEIEHYAKIAKEQGEYTLSQAGTWSEHPALRGRRATIKDMLSLEKLFGLVPDARKKRPAVAQGVASRPK